jgi:hypothetical protein
MITRYGIHRLLKITAYLVVILIVLGYAFFASHDFITGPTIEVFEPKNGTSFTDSSIHIKGNVQRIQEITLNGRPITIDDKGNFNEAALLSPGYNIFELQAHDKFGRSKDVRLELVYEVN